MPDIYVDNAPCRSDNDTVREGLISFNEKITGDRAKEFSVFMKDDSGEIVGGILTFYDLEAVYIDIFWVDEKFRNQGYGKKLLDIAEEEALKKGCVFSIADTMDFQAEAFYLKSGYVRMGVIENYWYRHSRIFLRKSLKKEILHDIK